MLRVCWEVPRARDYLAVDALTQRRVLWLAVGMTAAYAGSALLFAVAVAAHQRWFLVSAVALMAIGFAAATLIRPVALGFQRWWADAPTGRRAMNVLLLLVRAAGVIVFAAAAFAFSSRY